MTDDKIAAYTTLYTVLVTLAKISAPYVPFIAESIYLNLVPNFYKDAPISVHLCDFPKYNASMVDTKLEDAMEVIVDLVVLGRAARNSVNVKNRQPLSKVYVATERKAEFRRSQCGSAGLPRCGSEVGLSVYRAETLR